MRTSLHASCYNYGPISYVCLVARWGEGKSTNNNINKKPPSLAKRGNKNITTGGPYAELLAYPSYSLSFGANPLHNSLPRGINWIVSVMHQANGVISLPSSSGNPVTVCTSFSRYLRCLIVPRSRGGGSMPASPPKRSLHRRHDSVSKEEGGK